jgi:hypothetical protein
MGPQWLYVTLLVLGILSICAGIFTLIMCACTEDENTINFINKRIT